MSATAGTPRRDLIDTYLYHVWERRWLERQGEVYSSDWEYHDNRSICLWVEMDADETVIAANRHSAAKQNEANGVTIEFPHPGHEEGEGWTIGDAVRSAST